MKHFYIFLIILLLTASCSIGPVPIYYDQPIVKLIEDTLEIVIQVPDLDADGWENYRWNNAGEDTCYLMLEATEIENKDAFIYRIEYSLIVDNNEVDDGDFEFMIPLRITEMDTIDIEPELVIIVNEPTAYEIDVMDGYHDNVGKGIIEIKIEYTDEKGNEFSSLPVRKPFKLIKP